MKFFKKIFGYKPKDEGPPKRVSLSKENIESFPKFEKALTEGRVKFDSTGRLRYLHGAPVGDMILVRVNKDGTPIYKVSAQEWFDPESPKAESFIWP